MTPKTRLQLVMTTLVLTALGAMPAQAYTCEQQYQDCMAWAREERDDRVREIKEQQCNDDYSTCVNTPSPCGDAICGAGEDCSTCPSDCGTGNSTSESTSKSGCSYSSSGRWFSGIQHNGYCEYNVYEYGYVTCHVYRTITVYACNAPPTTTTVYEGTSSEYVPAHWVGSFTQSGYCSYY